MCDSSVRNRHRNGIKHSFENGETRTINSGTPTETESVNGDVRGRGRSSSSSTSSAEESIKRGRSKSTHRSETQGQQLKRSRSVPDRHTESKENNAIIDLLTGPRRAVAEAEDFVKNVIATGWRVVHHHHLPEWLQDNEHLLFGHRLPLNTFTACFKSVFRIHTETGNIWTHLLGMIAFISIAVYTFSSRYVDWMWQDITVHSVFFAGAIICLTFSWVFHTVFCHSEHVNKLFGKLDYCGIALLTVGSFVPWLYYCFYCNATAHIFYLVAIITLGTSCVVVSLFDKFAAPAYRPVRAGLFISLGLTGVIPAGHFVLLEGFYPAVFDYALGHLTTMAVLYIGGALMYAFRIPESIYPGKFDIWFQSHQIFHICVILAALVHFRGIQIISHLRINFTDCT